jgi:hypothetical protein
LASHLTNVRYWHLAENQVASAFVRYWSDSGRWAHRQRVAANGTRVSHLKRGSMLKIKNNPEGEVPSGFS